MADYKARIPQENKEKTKKKRKLRCPKFHLWRTSQMIPETECEKLINTVAREILILIILILLVGTIVLAMTSPSMYYLTRSLQKYFCETKFKNLGDDTITFHDVKTAADFWTYSEEILANGMNDQYWYHFKQIVTSTELHDNKVLYQNFLLGSARMRQLKVRNNSCPIHDYMVRNFHLCYAAFSRKAEDMSSFGSQTGTGWVYNTASDAPAVTYYGIVNVYGAGGFYRILRISATRSVITNLKQKFWLTKGTRIMIYEFSLYNANVNLVSGVKLAFEFPPTGGVLPSASFKTVHLFRYSSILDFFILVLELIYLVFVILFVIEEINEMRFFRKQYFKNGWNWVDLTIVLLSLTAFVWRIYKEILLFIVVRDESEYPNYERAVDMQYKYDHMLAFLMALFMLKLFRYLEYSPILGQLNLTLKQCAKNMIGFTIMFFIVFLAYAELGYLLFGSQVVAFSGFYTSMITLTRTILGDFEYGEIEACDTLYAPIYFLSYIFLVFFVLMNMFIAIVSDAYADIKVRKSIAVRTKREELYTLGLYKFFKMIRLSVCIPRSERKPICLTVYEVETILRGCGFCKRDIDQVLEKAGFTSKHKAQYLDFSKLVDEVDRKVYNTPPMPKLPEKLSAAQARVSLMSYEEFLKAEEKIKRIQGILVHLTTKLNFLLSQMPQ